MICRVYSNFQAFIFLYLKAEDAQNNIFNAALSTSRLFSKIMRYLSLN